MAMQLTSDQIVQSSFSVFPGYLKKFPFPGGFNRTTNGFYSCLGLCLLHIGCNVAFYNDKNKYCGGGNDTNLQTFLSTLIVLEGMQGYRLSTECDSAGYTFNRQTGQCLKIVKDKKTWDDARQYCEDDGGVLVKLDTTERVSGAVHTTSIYINGGASLYVGASDIASEGQWIWQDGTLLSGISTDFNNADFDFNPSVPANCGCLSKTLQTLNDVRCIVLKYFICERRELENK